MTTTSHRTTATVQADGNVSFSVPLPPGTAVEVIVVERGDELTDLLDAAGSSLGFWDNPIDDAEWNHVGPR